MYVKAYIRISFLIDNSIPIGFFFFLVRKIGPELTSVANLPLFFFFSPKPQYIVVYSSRKLF